MADGLWRDLLMAAGKPALILPVFFCPVRAQA